MNPFWQYYLSLEDDIIKFSRYVEFSKANYYTYSIELVKFFLSICSEIDVVAKLISKNLGNRGANTINGYKPIILNSFPELPNQVITIPKYGLKLIPWKNWLENDSPRWWTYYNKVKHQRNDNFKRANLYNTLNSLAGLLVMNLYSIKQNKTSLRSDYDVFMNDELSTKLLIPDGFNRVDLASGFIGWGGNIL